MYVTIFTLFIHPSVHPYVRPPATILKGQGLGKCKMFGNRLEIMAFLNHVLILELQKLSRTFLVKFIHPCLVSGHLLILSLSSWCNHNSLFSPL